ncbi:MAG: hypothetical protein Kow0049_00230 [Stanieria sp.]
MKCPRCESSSYRKNGLIKGRQRYLCKICGRQFLLPVPASNHDYCETINSQTVKSTSIVSSATAKTGIAILLIDAENIRLDVAAENFLQEISELPLQVKIAFANWRNSSMAKRDSELHDRGYQLIHVPEGSNSADGKMIAIGSSIFLQYPETKEVFICSNDLIFTHLCTELQNRGLIIHRVHRENHCLQVEHRHTNTVSSYSFEFNSSVPSLEKLMASLEEIINWKYATTTEMQDKLSNLTALWQERKKNPLQFLFDSKFNFEQEHKLVEIEQPQTILSQQQLEQAIITIIQQHQSLTPAQEVSIAMVSNELKKKYGESGSQIVKRLKLKPSFTKFIQSSQLFATQTMGKTYKIILQNQEKPEFHNPQWLEKALLKILQELLQKSQSSCIHISRLSDEFKKQYGLPTSTILKQLRLKNSFLAFLQSCSVFKIEKIDKVYHVAIASIGK